jgi:hypothetical protein
MRHLDAGAAPFAGFVFILSGDLALLAAPMK